MEGLIQLIAEALAALLAPLVEGFVLLIVLALGALSSLGSAIFKGIFSRTPPAAALETAPVPGKGRRLALRLALGFAGLVLLGWVLMEFVLFPSILTSAARHLSEKSGIEFSYASAS